MGRLWQTGWHAVASCRWLWSGGIWSNALLHWVCVLTVAVLGASCGWMRRQNRLQAVERWRERRMREELEAYARLDASTQVDLARGLDAHDAQKALAGRVCRVVAEHSVFKRVTMLLRNPEGRFGCMGSTGVDDLTVAALHRWGEEVVAGERLGAKNKFGWGEGGRVPSTAAGSGMKSFAIALGEWQNFDREVGSWALSGKKERRRWRRGIVAPIWVGGGSGRMVGAIAVCADGGGADGWMAGLDKAMGAIEALAAKLARTIENEAMAERLLRAEKLAGLGQLAGGVAHALNNPLTAVLGFAELINETSAEPRVRKDAGTIALEALKMKETVARLLEFWRPVTLSDEPVEMSALLGELAAACEGKLLERGVKLEMLSDGRGVPPVRGNRDRLRQMMEHLLNNSAQAIAGAGHEEGDDPHAIRLTLSHDERALHIIVSDSGPGFKEPSRVFDPFYTTRGPEQGAGLGLSICYGIVREHGGEISAFNLHPHGAAVVIDLPLRKTFRPENVIVMEERRAS